MSCLCSRNTLRSFIRSVAQLDLATGSPASFSRSARLDQLQQRAPYHRSSPRLQYATPISPESTQLSDSSRNFRDARPIIIPVDQEYTDGDKNKDDNNASQTSNDVDLSTVFAEISTETIDALAAESAAEPTQPTIRREDDIEGDEDHYTDAPTRRRGGDADKNRSAHMSSPRLGREHRDSERVEFRRHSSLSSHEAIENNKPASSGDDWKPPTREPWQSQKAALKDKFEGGWQPMKKLSPDALAGIRALNAQMPEVYTTAALADSFKVSPEAIRRILKSKWTPKQDEEIDRQKRWFKRGEKVWTRLADEQNIKPPKKWREQGVGADYFTRRQAQRDEAEKATAEREVRFAFHNRARNAVLKAKGEKAWAIHREQTPRKSTTTIKAKPARSDNHHIPWA